LSRIGSDLEMIHNKSSIIATTTAPDDRWRNVRAQLDKLAAIVSASEYYRYHDCWNRQLQQACHLLAFEHFTTKCGSGDGGSFEKQLCGPELIETVLGVPVDITTAPAAHANLLMKFHVPAEDYLHGLVGLSNELSRLAVTSVINGRYEWPARISAFISQLHSGFQLLNLKNDSLRRRFDSIKYDIKRCEEVVYQLKLRQLVP
jgi:hypothetical protein